MTAMPGARDELLDSPWRSVPLRTFQNWCLGQRNREEEPSGRSAFGLTPEDVIVIPVGARSPDSLFGNRDLAAQSVRMFGLVQKNRVPLRELARAGGMSLKCARSLIEPGLGRCYEAESRLVLEKAVGHLGIVRWPCSPYSIGRNYWRNCADVREEMAELRETAGDFTRFWRTLSRLHTIYLMGRNLDSFYLPKSPICDQMREWTNGPGQLRTCRVHCRPPEVFRDGYLEYLAGSYGEGADEDACIALRGGRDLIWGEYKTSWTIKEYYPNRVRAYFPVEAITGAHLEKLWESAQELYCGRLGIGECRRAAARLLYRFVLLHPFTAGNMGLVMTLVNGALGWSEGKCLPHFHLDWVAHRISEESFIQVFCAAFDMYGTNGDQEESWLARSGRLRDAIKAIAMMSEADTVAWFEGSAEARRTMLMAPPREGA